MLLQNECLGDRCVSSVNAAARKYAKTLSISQILCKLWPRPSAAPLDVVKLPAEGFSEDQGHCSLNLDRLSPPSPPTPPGRLCKQHMSSSFGQKHVL